MTRFILTRCLFALASLFILSVTIFVLIRLTGDPATLLAAPDAKEADLAAIRVQLGLDRSWPVQYVHFVGGALRGDFGMSLYYRVPAGTLYWQRLPASLHLAAVAMAISLLVGLSVGILAAVHVGRWWDSVGKL
ncbi:MAG: ABC transporter permease, partial [Candidatus Rokuibacteriota bacterium]